MTAVLIGSYQHNIDAKGRVFIPVKLREDIGERFVVTKGLDGCLWGYSQEEWEKIAQNLISQPFKARDVQRFFMQEAEYVEVDKQGRVVLPARLREFAQLAKEVMITGVGSRIEIWDLQKHTEMTQNITQDKLEDVMDSLGF